MMKFIILALSDNHIESNRGVKRGVPHFPDGDSSVSIAGGEDVGGGPQQCGCSP